VIDIDADFPSHTLHPERVLYRIHRTTNAPIYFASDDLGRFNLMDVPGAGTCYVSPSPVGAYIETFGRLGTISEDDLAERSLSELALSRSVRLADLTDRQVLGRYRIAGDISTGTDYQPSQRLASALYAVGFDGIYYTARHDPAFLERSVAIFGGPDDEKLFIVAATPIPQELAMEAARDFGLLVLPAPS
jgi:RES domain